jgi:hypothetical protein
VFNKTGCAKVQNDIEVDLGWLIIPPQETVLLTVSMPTLRERVKHFSRQQHRLYACLGQNCDFCMRGTPKRIRYQVRVTFNGQWWWWEFGKQVYKLIKDKSGDDDSVRLLITRIDEGRRTRYWISRISEELQLPEPDRLASLRTTNTLRR